MKQTEERHSESRMHEICLSGLMGGSPPGGHWPRAFHPTGVSLLYWRVVEGIDVTDDEEGHHTLASRIEALVQEGRLTAQGKLKRWRHSEVRLP